LSQGNKSAFTVGTMPAAGRSARPPISLMPARNLPFNEVTFRV
jgi:hypothetical protein